MSEREVPLAKSALVVVGGDQERKETAVSVVCDVCQVPVSSPNGDPSATQSVMGRTTLLCVKCQEDILNSNRMLSS
jgi:hypothetical protein